MNCLQGADEDLQSGAPEVQETKKQKQSVAQRWLTALVAIPIVLLFVWFGGWAAFAATLLALVLCTVELHNMLSHAGYRPLTWVSFALSTLFLLAAMLPSPIRLLLLEWGFGAALLLSFLFLFLRKQLDGALVDWALTLAISLYLGWSMSCFLLLRGYQPGTLQFAPSFLFSLPAGGWWLLFVMLGVWGCDSAAFFTGRYFGRHKLAPKISPAKTWEGFVGGMALAVIAALVLTVAQLGVPWYLAIVFGLLLGGAAVLGDLAESLMKRQTHVKDSGQLLPGHGGMLDRVDSLIFAVVVVYACAQLLPFLVR